MKVISPTAHGWLDYVTVVVFALGPTVVGLSGVAAVLAYILAVVHLVLTLATSFAPGLAPIVPLNLHGAVELIVGLVLTLGGFLVGVFSDLLTGTETAFYVVVGIVILAAWGLTDYASAEPARRARGR